MELELELLELMGPMEGTVAEAPCGSFPMSTVERLLLLLDVDVVVVGVGRGRELRVGDAEAGCEVISCTRCCCCEEVNGPVDPVFVLRLGSTG